MVYVGQIRPEPEEGQTEFYRNVLSTMTYDLCGLVHAGEIGGHNGCAGCGECFRLRTWDLLGEEPPFISRTKRVEEVQSPTLEEFLEIVRENGGTYPREVV